MRRKIQVGIYYIQNKKNKKLYIGSSINITKRFKEHKKTLKTNIHHNNYLQRAYNKYGKNIFIFKLLEITSKSKLIKREQFWINKYNSYKKGYNINPFAGSALGIKDSKETRKKKSLVRIGKLMSKKTKEKLSKINKGRHHTKEIKRKLSKIYKGRKLSKKWKENISKGKKGKKLTYIFTKKHKQNMSKSKQAFLKKQKILLLTEEIK